MGSSVNLAAKPLRIGMVAGEESGDILGAGLISHLKRRYPDAIFEGIGGSRMIEQGFKSFFPQDRLAVMGFVEPLKRLPELLRMRKTLADYFVQKIPDVFIGIDSPDFNLHLEMILRNRGIRVAHYVSPSVWAWRQGRIKKIQTAVDLMLTLFPFENAIYERHHIHAVCVGHPLADSIPLDDQTLVARQALGIAPDAQVLAVLPGSRQAEVERLGAMFFEVASRLAADNPALIILCPAANPKRLEQLKVLLAGRDLKVNVQLGNSHQLMAAADAVLMASGTTSLEAMLLKKPMVIAYKVAPVSYWIYKRLVKVSMIGLPNLLAGEKIVPEFIQDAATTDNLCQALGELLRNRGAHQRQKEAFLRLHQSLRRDANQQAANAIQGLIETSLL
ncbi:MAG TPA: lipid-A-disaccharide synthase [Cellvibrionaceae bacterium]|nr:lipid-A-disaccharide synthase [Cellvibrionaceae bacterium]HMY39011.1 lipid-A-disaccharide synthase [Marinagarivorans sp.]